MAITSATLEKLKKYDSPTICNVIELFDVRSRSQGYMDHRIRSNYPTFPPMVGFASTASFRSSFEPPRADAYGSITEQLKHMQTLPGPAVMVFQDLDDLAVGATFGEVMCSTYKGFGSAGLITSGGGRDLEQVRALQYPVFTASTIVSHAYCHILHVGQPVCVGGLPVFSGDLLHGDANGVTNIPLDIATEVADICEPFVQAEEIIMTYVKEPGQKSPDEFARRQAECKNAMAELRKRVSRKR